MGRMKPHRTVEGKGQVYYGVCLIQSNSSTPLGKWKKTETSKTQAGIEQKPSSHDSRITTNEKNGLMERCISSNILPVLKIMITIQPPL